MSAARAEPPTCREAAAEERRLRWRSRLLAAFWAAAFRLQLATWRLHSDGLDDLDRRLAGGQGAFIVFWHGKYLPLFAILRGRKACVFTSLSDRGDVIADLCRRFGYRAIQIPDRGREKSLDIMRRALSAERLAATAVDGPLGPFHVVKRGAIQLASELGWSLVPISVAARSRWLAEKRWDRMELPLPFTRIHLVVGEPMAVPAGISAEDLEAWKSRIREALERLDKRAEASAAGDASQGFRR